MSLPLSRTSISASSFAFGAIRSPSLRSSAPRCVAVSLGQSPSVKALCAARAARSTSAGPARGMSAHGFPVYGLTLSKVAPEAASTHSPPMNILYFVSDAVAVSINSPQFKKRRADLAGVAAGEGVDAAGSHWLLGIIGGYEQCLIGDCICRI